MTMHDTDFEKVIEISQETGVPAGEVEKAPEIEPYVVRRGGFRVVPGDVAERYITRVLAERAQARSAAKREAREGRLRFEDQQERARADRADDRSRVQKLALQTITVTPDGAEGVPPVVAMTARANKAFDGSVMTPRPSRLDWMSGNVEGGRQIGPSPQEIMADAAARAAARKAEKKGGQR